MSDRDLVIQSLTRRMVGAFVKGDHADAQNLNAFITDLEGMTDGDYVLLISSEVAPSDIA